MIQCYFHTVNKVCLARRPGAHYAIMMSFRRWCDVAPTRCDVITSHRISYGVILTTTLNDYWAKMRQQRSNLIHCFNRDANFTNCHPCPFLSSLCWQSICLIQLQTKPTASRFTFGHLNQVLLTLWILWHSKILISVRGLWFLFGVALKMESSV